MGFDVASGRHRATWRWLPSSHRLAQAPLRVRPWVALALVFVVSDASAAAFGGLSATTGLFAMLAALVFVQSWPGQFVGTTMFGLGAILVVCIGAAVMWRAQRRALAAAEVACLPQRGAPTRARQPAGLLSPVQPVALPRGVDRARLLGDLRQHFVALQLAWDAGEVDALRGLTTAEMLCELVAQLPVRGPGTNRTDVLTLHADLIGFEELGVAHLASVEFSGMIRESPELGAAPFRELWMLVRSGHETGNWQLARQQPLS